MKTGIIGLRALGHEGGIESFCRYIYPEMAEQDHEFIFYTRRRYGGETNWRGMTSRALRCIPFHGLETTSYGIAAVVRAVLWDRVDVIHLHAVGLGFLAPVARLWGCGVVVRHVGADWRRPKWGPIGRLALITAEHCAGRFANVVVCLDETSANDFLARTAARAQIQVIRNAIPEFEVSPSDAKALPEGLEAGRYVLSVSRITAEKGIITLINAYRRSGLFERGVKLAIAGEAFGRGAFKQEVRKLAGGVKGCVLLGQQAPQALKNLYSQSAVFVNASTHEGMSFSALEALVAGCNCVFSDIRENRQIGSEHARYFRVTDAGDLAALLVCAVDAPPSPMMRERQRDDILSRHSVAETARLTKAALDRAYQRSRATRRSVFLMSLMRNRIEP